MKKNQQNNTLNIQLHKILLSADRYEKQSLDSNKADIRVLIGNAVYDGNLHRDNVDTPYYSYHYHDTSIETIEDKVNEAHSETLKRSFNHYRFVLNESSAKKIVADYFDNIVVAKKKDRDADIPSLDYKIYYITGDSLVAKLNTAKEFGLSISSEFTDDIINRFEILSKENEKFIAEKKINEKIEFYNKASILHMVDYATKLLKDSGISIEMNHKSAGEYAANTEYGKSDLKAVITFEYIDSVGDVNTKTLTLRYEATYTNHGFRSSINGYKCKLYNGNYKYIATYTSSETLVKKLRNLYNEFADECNVKVAKKNVDNTQLEWMEKNIGKNVAIYKVKKYQTNGINKYFTYEEKEYVIQDLVSAKEDKYGSTVYKGIKMSLGLAGNSIDKGKFFINDMKFEMASADYMKFMSYCFTLGTIPENASKSFRINDIIYTTADIKKIFAKILEYSQPSTWTIGS